MSQRPPGPPRTIGTLRRFERPRDEPFGRVVYQGEERTAQLPADEQRAHQVAHEYWLIERGPGSDWELIEATATFDRDGGFTFHDREVVGHFGTNLAALEALEERSTRPTASEMAGRPHSIRHYSPDEFRAALEGGASKEDLRAVARQIEDGRFVTVLDATGRFFRPLDRDEREDFYRQNPGLMEWVRVWNVLEDLGDPFPNPPEIEP